MGKVNPRAVTESELETRSGGGLPAERRLGSDKVRWKIPRTAPRVLPNKRTRRRRGGGLYPRIETASSEWSHGSRWDQNIIFRYASIAFPSEFRWPSVKGAAILLPPESVATCGTCRCGDSSGRRTKSASIRGNCLELFSEEASSLESRETLWPTNGDHTPGSPRCARDHKP